MVVRNALSVIRVWEERGVNRTQVQECRGRRNTPQLPGKVGTGFADVPGNGSPEF